jgi:hypothetical protein
VPGRADDLQLYVMRLEVHYFGAENPCSSRPLAGIVLFEQQGASPPPPPLPPPQKKCLTSVLALAYSARKFVKRVLLCHQQRRPRVL